MRRFRAIFIAVCMTVIAASVGALPFFVFKADLYTSVLVGLSVLTALVLYNTASGRLRDRNDVADQIADLSRGTADLAHQVVELSRRLGAVETSVNTTLSRARSAVDPLAAEIGELGGLVRQIADTVAAHEAALHKEGASVLHTAADVSESNINGSVPLTISESDAVSAPPEPPQKFSAEELARIIDSNSIDLYLQPIVTLPQRKVRYYEAMSRVRTEAGEIVPAIDFIDIAENAGLMPRIDNLLVLRCVQVLRRLQTKSRDVGLFCNISAATLGDPIQFKQFLDFMTLNRVLAPALIFEFTQAAFRGFGAVEFESLAALAERGFHFSMDHVTDLRMEPKSIAARSFRYLKVPAKLLLSEDAHGDIHPEDFAGLLARSNVDLIAERIESETMVLDLLDYDVRFGQGFLFSPPRPVRPEALHSVSSAKAPYAGIALTA